MILKRMWNCIKTLAPIFMVDESGHCVHCSYFVLNPKNKMCDICFNGWK